MATVIVGIIVAICLFFALKGVIKHWRGESSCCGGAALELPPKKKLNGKIIGTKVINIEGMTCGHCKARVEMLLDDIEGAVSEVNLHHNRAELKMTREVADDEIYAALKDSEYKITAINRE